MWNLSFWWVWGRRSKRQNFYGGNGTISPFPFSASSFLFLFPYPYFQKQVVCFSLCQKRVVPLNRERFSYDARFRVDVSHPAASQSWLWSTKTPCQPPVCGNHCPEDGGNSILVVALLPFQVLPFEVGGSLSWSPSLWRIWKPVGFGQSLAPCLHPWPLLPGLETSSTVVLLRTHLSPSDWYTSDQHRLFPQKIHLWDSEVHLQGEEKGL